MEKSDLFSSNRLWRTTYPKFLQSREWCTLPCFDCQNGSRFWIESGRYRTSNRGDHWGVWRRAESSISNRIQERLIQTNTRSYQCCKSRVWWLLCKTEFLRFSWNLSERGGWSILNWRLCQHWSSRWRPRTIRFQTHFRSRYCGCRWWSPPCLVDEWGRE